MSILKILQVPHPALSKVSKQIERVDKRIQKLSKDMLDTMYDASGIGLAAPQVGKNIRLIVVDVPPEEVKKEVNLNSEEGVEGGKKKSKKKYKKNPIILINPEIINSSKNRVNFNEGCLSVPDELVEMSRYETIEVVYLDENGLKKMLLASGLLAICVQHEIDHLNGKTIADKLLERVQSVNKDKRGGEYL